MRIAGFIDAENIPPRLAGMIRTRLAEQGILVHLRAIGDFSVAAMQSWTPVAAEHGIDLDLQPFVGTGKNGADMAIAIEATIAASSGRFDAIAIASKDADFTPVAYRLRRMGVPVIGLAPAEGCSKQFRAACSLFLALAAPAEPVIVLPSPGISGADLHKAYNIICNVRDTDGWVSPSVLGMQMRRAFPAPHPLVAAKTGMMARLVGLGLLQVHTSGDAPRFRPAPQPRFAA